MDSAPLARVGAGVRTGKASMLPSTRSTFDGERIKPIHPVPAPLTRARVCG